jgi:hypothetical protein
VSVAYGTARARLRRRGLAYGTWDPFVSVEDAREVVDRLRGAGLSGDAIAAAAGLSTAIVVRITYPSARGAYTKVTRGTYDALTRVRLDPHHLPAEAMIDATGTRRRIQALTALGWTHETMGEHLGVTGTAVWQMTRRPKVTARNAVRVAAMYGPLSMRLGPSETARRRAAKAGHCPPLAWDDDAIDDPAARPTGLADARQRRRSELVEDVADMLADDATVAGACARLEMSRKALQRALQRAGRHDLWRRLTGSDPLAYAPEEATG